MKVFIVFILFGIIASYQVKGRPESDAEQQLETGSVLYEKSTVDEMFTTSIVFCLNVYQNLYLLGNETMKLVPKPTKTTVGEMYIDCIDRLGPARTTTSDCLNQAKKSISSCPHAAYNPFPNNKYFNPRPERFNDFHDCAAKAIPTYLYCKMLAPEYYTM